RRRLWGVAPLRSLPTRRGWGVAAISQIRDRLADPIDVGFHLRVGVHVGLDPAAKFLVRQPTEAREEVVDVRVAKHVLRHRRSDYARRLGQVGGRAARSRGWRRGGRGFSKRQCGAPKQHRAGHRPTTDQSSHRTARGKARQHHAFGPIVWSRASNRYGYRHCKLSTTDEDLAGNDRLSESADSGRSYF